MESWASTRKDDAATEVHGLCRMRIGGKDVCGGADSHYAVSGDRNGAVPVDMETAVHGDDNRIVEDEICRRGRHCRVTLAPTDEESAKRHRKVDARDDTRSGCSVLAIY